MPSNTKELNERDAKLVQWLNEAYAKEAELEADLTAHITLTAKDTYRTRMSSFEALNELRREAGSQFDARYVEILAGLLRGEGVGYRHADEADFDTELDMERRVVRARAG